MLGIGLGRAARRLRRRADQRHRQHALHRHGRGAAGAHARRSSSLAFAVGVPLSLAGRAGCRRARRAGCRRRRPSAATIGSSRASGSAARADRAGARARPAPLGSRSWARSTAGRSSATPRRLSTIVGAALLVPAIIYGLARAGARGRCAGCSASKGLLAHANLAAAIPRLSISIAALAGEPVDDGGHRGDDRQLPRDGRLLGRPDAAGRSVHRPGVRPTVGSEQTLSAAVIEAVRAHPDVAAVDSFRNIDLVYEGNLVVLGAGTVRRRARRTARCCSRRRPTAARRCARAIGTESVIVSEAFANATAPQPGDTLTLADAGRAAAVLRRRGLLRLRRRSRRDRDGPPHVRALLRRAAAHRHRRLSARRRRSRTVRSEILDGLDGATACSSTRTARCATRCCASSTARSPSPTRSRSSPSSSPCWASAATLLTLVIERRRELSMLRLIGAARRQVRAMVVIEAALIGAVSQAIGLVVGCALSLILVYVINVQSFGWTIQFRVPWRFWRRCRSRSSSRRRWPASIPRAARHGWWWRTRSRCSGSDAASGVQAYWRQAARDWRTSGVSHCVAHLASPDRTRTHGWREATAGYRFAFPRDHASHPDYKIEWWYYTGNLADGAGPAIRISGDVLPRRRRSRRRRIRRAGRCATST